MRSRRQRRRWHLLTLLMAILTASGCEAPRTELPREQEEAVSSLLESLNDLQSHGGGGDPKAVAALTSDLRVLTEDLRSLRASALLRESGLSEEEEQFLRTVTKRMADAIQTNGNLSSALRSTIDEGRQIAKRHGTPWITSVEPGLWSGTAVPASIRVTLSGVHLDRTHLDAQNVPCATIEASDHAVAFACPGKVFQETPVSTVTGNWARISLRLTVLVRSSVWFLATEDRIFNLQATRIPDYAGRATITVSEQSSEDEVRERDQAMTISGSACRAVEQVWNIDAQDGWSIVSDSVQVPPLGGAGVGIQTSVVDIRPNRFAVLIRSVARRCATRLFGQTYSDVRFRETAHVRWRETRRAIVARQLARDELIAWGEEKTFTLPKELTKLTLTFQRSDGSIGTWDGVAEVPPGEWFEIKRVGNVGAQSLSIRAKPLAAIL